MHGESDASTLGKGLTFKGAISGTGSLHVDGAVIGSINIPEERVTIGQHGRVVSSMSANMNVCVAARHIVVIGSVEGQVVASESVEIRASGKLVGDIETCRITIADGAFFKGSINIRQNG